MWLLRVVVNGCLFWVSVSGLNDSRSIAHGGKKQRFFYGRNGTPNVERPLISFRCSVGAVRRFFEPQARRYTNSGHCPFPGSLDISLSFTKTAPSHGRAERKSLDGKNCVVVQTARIHFPVVGNLPRHQRFLGLRPARGGA